MIKLKYSIFWSFLLSIGIQYLHGATGDLVSVKKGAVDGKAWAVCYFEDTVPWVGVSQSESEKLSLYFNGHSAELKGSLIQLDPYGIYIQQLRDNPPVCRLDILYEGDIPLAIVRKNNLLVLSFNDTRVSMESIENGEKYDRKNAITNVSNSVQGERARTAIDFDHVPVLSGFIRLDRDNPKLILQNVVNGLRDSEFWFQEGDLSNLVLQADQTTNSTQIHLNFNSGATYSIAQKQTQLVVESSVSKTQLFAQEEAVATISDDLGTRITVTDSPSTQTQQPEPKFSLPTQVSYPDQTRQSEDELLAAQSLSGDPDTVSRLLSDGGQWQGKPLSGEKISTALPNPDIISSNFYRTQTDESPVKTLQMPESALIPWDDMVSFDFRETPLIDALRTIAVSYDLNMVIAEGVEGKVTLSLRNISLKRALDKMIHLHGCDYTVDDDIITVKPVKAVYKGGMVTRIYRLKFADAENLRSVIGKIASQDSLVQVFHPEFLNFDEAGKNRREYNKVAVQGIRRASILIVTDTQNKIEEIDQVITELDRAPAQIRINSKLVEMAPEDVQNIGIDWEQTLSLAQNISKGSTGKEKSLQITNTGTDGEPFDLQNTVNLGQLTQTQYLAMIDFLREKTDSKLISNPSLLAMDNEEASISVGTTVPIPQIQRGAGGTGDMVTFNYKEVNIQLNVSPHIGRNGEIVMFINPVIEEITGWVELGVSRAPITAKRTVNSIVTVKDGETLVVGGLIKTQRIKTTKKLFLLGNIPLIGPLFQHESYEDRETNLLIFITPTIVTT